MTTTMDGDYLDEDDLADAKNTTFGEIEELEDVIDKKFRNFKNFGVLQSVPPDHHFIGRRRSVRRVDPEKIKSEWEALKISLPSSIYVRTYESRIDLMRVAFTGLEDTPSRHGLFFVDLHIPQNYPTNPPEITYRGILGFNYDRNISVRPWIPEKKSGILQVLIWIQDQILNDKPCCLLSDSGYSKSRSETFMLSCEAMIYTLGSPLMGFEDFVSGYFRKCAHAILLIYKNEIGKDNLFFDLVSVFETNGAHCRHHYNEEEMRKRAEEFATEKSQCKVTFLDDIIEKIESLLRRTRIGPELKPKPKPECQNLK